jgi:hypothetical protein
MKKVTLFATMILAVAMSASAQRLIDFTNMPDKNTSTPEPVPAGYGGLNWSNVYYVDALTYGDADGHPNSGPGFYSGPEALVAFIGGPLCFPKYGAKVNDGMPTKNICSASISSWVGPTAFNYFQVDLLTISAGWIPGQATFQAYKDGVQVGSDFHENLTTSAKTLKISDGSLPNWGKISELRITPGPKDSVVLYDLEVQ